MNSTDGRRVELLRWKHQCGGLELVWNRNWWVSFWIQHTERWTKCKFQVDWPSSAIGRIGVHSFVEDAESQKYWTDHENYPYFWICTLSYVVKSGKQLFSEPTDHFFKIFRTTRLDLESDIIHSILGMHLSTKAILCSIYYVTKIKTKILRPMMGASHNRQGIILSYILENSECQFDTYRVENINF